jgi:CheY-like chemotaxis protein
MDMKLNGKVLIADDNPSNQLLLRILLDKFGIATCVVNNGLEAVNKLKNEKFDLLLLDIQMPVMTGFEAAQTIRASGNNIPIIALTASTSSSEIRKCKDCGCNEYLPKPISKENLFDAIKCYLNSNENNKKFGDNSFVSSLAGDGELQSVINVFMDDLPQMLENINAANSKDDLELIQGLAHELKGASGSAGFNVLTEYAADLEDTVNQGQLTTAHKVVEQINSYCRELIEKQST